ncbi:Gfo/Idh/MocA family oxidoreductase [Algoriphagus boritolerans]|uniref:Gfo/Idh/MocA family oxidoreductase n=1 Tax=Algoriphagus boritolerans TaxID=308111 RepID=UPI002FCE5A72
MAITGFFYQNVADAIRKEAELQVTLPQTISVLKIIEAAFKSAGEGRKITSNESNW